MEVGGIPDLLWNKVIALYWEAKRNLNPEEDILDDFCQKHLSKADYQSVLAVYEQYFVKDHPIKWCAFFDRHFDDTLSPLLDKQTLANDLLAVGHRGIAKYCLEQQTQPAIEVLKLLTKAPPFQEYLNLEDLELDELPKEVGAFIQIRSLSITGNNFTELPDEIQHLKNLSNLDFASDGMPEVRDTPLSEAAIDKIKRFFPRLWSYKLAYRAEILLSKNYPGYESATIQSATAHRFLEEALTLEPQSAYALTIKAAHLEQAEKIEESLKYAQQALTLDAQFAWPRRVLVDGLYQLKKFEACIVACEPGIEHGKTITRPDYDDMWFLNHFHCSKAEAFYQLKQWAEALEAYQAIPNIWRSGFRKGLVAYHMACLYAHTQEKDLSLEYLENAIAEDDRFVKEAQQEPFFALYRQDATFMRLLDTNQGEDDTFNPTFV